MDVEKWRRMSDEALGKELLRTSTPTGSVVLDVLIGILIVLLVYGQIAKRAGFPRVLSLGLLVPILGGLLPLVFAMVPWPVERRRAPAKRRSKR